MILDMLMAGIHFPFDLIKLFYMSMKFLYKNSDMNIILLCTVSQFFGFNNFNNEEIFHREIQHCTKK